jgi:hypothetical protein
MFIFTRWVAVSVSSAALIGAAHAQDYAGRKELKRSDLTGTNMEVIVSISERSRAKPSLGISITERRPSTRSTTRPSNYLTVSKFLSKLEMLT